MSFNKKPHKLFIIRAMKIITCLMVMLIIATSVNAQTFSKNIQLTEEEHLWIAEHPVVTATNNTNMVPFDFVRNGQPMGFTIDYLNLIADTVGLKVEYQNSQTWGEQLGNIKQQKIDITHSLIQNTDRDEYLNFTEPYMEIPIVQFGRKGSQPLNNISDFEGKKIGVIQGRSIADFYRENYPDFPLTEYTTIKDALNGLSSNEVDIVTGSLSRFNYYISINFLNNIEVIGNDRIFNSTHNVNLRLATRRDYPVLRDILQKGMDAVTPEQFRAISDRWKTDFKTTGSIDFTPEELEWISDHPKIRVTNKKELAPLDFTQGGVASGFSVDYLNLIAQKSGFNIEYVSGLLWSEMLDLLKDKKIDVSHTIIQTAERDEYLDFTEPYLSLPWAYFGRIGSDALMISATSKVKRSALLRAHSLGNYIRKNTRT